MTGKYIVTTMREFLQFLELVTEESRGNTVLESIVLSRGEHLLLNVSNRRYLGFRLVSEVNISTTQVLEWKQLLKKTTSRKITLDIDTYNNLLEELTVLRDKLSSINNISSEVDSNVDSIGMELLIKPTN